MIGIGCSSWDFDKVIRERRKQREQEQEKYDVEYNRRMKEMTDPVNHPPHYKSHPSGIECIEITRHMNFNLGNAVKYIWRAGEKGNTIQDLQKAIWYLTDEIQRISQPANGTVTPLSQEELLRILNHDKR